MKSSFALLNLPLLAILSACATQQSNSNGNNIVENDDNIVAKSSEIIGTYQGRLMAKLGEALKNGGPKAGIEVCTIASPQIAQDVSKSSGAEIKRISLQPRSPLAVPTDIQREFLNQWLQSPLKPDESPKDVAYKANENGREYIYYMRAITLKEKPCTTCHGKNIAPEVKAAIDKSYPNDKATGYAAGDLRGAFLVKWRAADFK